MIACPKCGKEFKNQIAVKMHNARVHTRTVSKRDSSLSTVAIFEQIARDYGTQGYIELRRALDEHPEWRTALSHITEGSIRARATRILRNRPEGALPSAEVPVAPVQSSDPASNESFHINFCPRCGLELDEWRRGWEMLQKLPPAIRRKLKSA